MVIVGAVLIAVMLFSAVPFVSAELAIESTKVAYSTPTGENYPSSFSVSGTLRKPANAQGKLAAILILHGSGGLDGRGAFHSQALNEAGFATLEIQMFSRGGRPRLLRDTLPHTFGALQFLAAQPDIDPKRIGVMGFSWGGALSIVSALTHALRMFPMGDLKFAAHMPFYPACSLHLRIATDPSYRGYKNYDYSEVTGAPVHILAGEWDDYDDPDSCQKLLDSLSPQVRNSFLLTMFPRARHSWDMQGLATRFFDEFANKGRGGTVNVSPDPKVAEQSRRMAVEFFRKHLGPSVETP